MKKFFYAVVTISIFTILIVIVKVNTIVMWPTHQTIQEEPKIEYVCANGWLYTHIGDGVLEIHHNNCDVSSDCIIDTNSNTKYKCIDRSVYIKIPDTNIYKEARICRRVMGCTILKEKEKDND